MPVIVKSNGISIILIDSGCSDYWFAKIAANMFSDYFRVAEIGFGMVEVEKLAGYYTEDRKEETVQERPVLKKKVAEILSNCKNTMVMMDMDEFEGHTSGACNAYLVPQVVQKRLWQRKGTNLKLPQ